MNIIITFMVLLVVAFWHAVGISVLANLPDYWTWMDESKGLEFLNPGYIRKHLRVNIFGLCLVTIALNMLCPLLSIGYWLYFLGTIGAKEIKE